MVMLLNGANGAEFELALIQDRFPDLQDGGEDSAFLTLSFRVGTQDESWEETAPCMNLYEVQTLQEWLDAVGEGRGEVAEVELIEPGLRFSVVGSGKDSVTMRVDFRLDDQPEELSLGANGEVVDHITLRLTRDQVRAGAAELRQDLEAIIGLRPGAQADGERLGVFGVPDEALLETVEDDSVAPMDEVRASEA